LDKSTEIRLHSLSNRVCQLLWPNFRLTLARLCHKGSLMLAG